MVLFAIAAQCVRSALVHIALFATAALCVRSPHVRYYAVCGHLLYGIARYSSALCLKYGIIQCTCIAFYDLATQCVRLLYVRIIQDGSAVCKVTTCMVLYYMATLFG